MNIQSTVFREAANDDSESIKKLIFSILESYGLRPDPGATDADLDNIEKNYSGGIFLVMEENSGIIGTGGLYPLDRRVAEIRKMYLHGDHRGRGLGREILERLLREAKHLGFKRVTLETASVLQEALGLYRRYGFREHTPEHLSSRCDQAFYLDL